MWYLLSSCSKRFVSSTCWHTIQIQTFIRLSIYWIFLFIFFISMHKLRGQSSTSVSCTTCGSFKNLRAWLVGGCFNTNHWSVSTCLSELLGGWQCRWWLPLFPRPHRRNPSRRKFQMTDVGGYVCMPSRAGVIQAITLSRCQGGEKRLRF